MPQPELSKKEQKKAEKDRKKLRLQEEKESRKRQAQEEKESKRLQAQEEKESKKRAAAEKQAAKKKGKKGSQLEPDAEPELDPEADLRNADAQQDAGGAAAQGHLDAIQAAAEKRSRKLMMNLKRELSAMFKLSGVGLEQQFRGFDADGNGQIDREEFRGGLLSLGAEITEAQIEDMITLLDKDGDGAIDYQEFARWFGAGPPPPPMTPDMRERSEAQSAAVTPQEHLDAIQAAAEKRSRALLMKLKDELAADVCIVSDTGMWDIRTPAITTMLRGMVYVEVTLHGPSSDLHSGMYGGAVTNPINELTRLLGMIHDEDGRVRFDGFYDDVVETTDEMKAQWETLGFDEKAFLGMIGLERGQGESGRSTLERTWSRPTCDINGIIGGYTGDGAKTVIAAHATAKLSCRLVANQDPDRVRESIQQFFRTNMHPDCRVEFEDHGCNPAISVPTDSHWLASASSALKDVFGVDALLIGTGGSIPAVGSIQDILGIDSLLIGFGLDDDNVHAPNEKFELTCLQNGIRSHAAILDAFVTKSD